MSQDKGMEAQGLTPDGVVGEITEQAHIALKANQQAQQNLTYQIGAVEVQKSKLLWELDNLQQQARRILNSEVVRLGIPQGRGWQLTPEGKIVLTG